MASAHPANEKDRGFFKTFSRLLFGSLITKHGLPRQQCQAKIGYTLDTCSGDYTNGLENRFSH
jgi:hypothetical protein